MAKYPSGSEQICDTEKAYDVAASWLKVSAENSDKPGVKFLEDRLLELEVELVDRLKDMSLPETACFFERKIESLDEAVESNLPLTVTATHKEA
jgi:hypothetical protein